jgi:hypothetical protein
MNITKHYPVDENVFSVYGVEQELDSHNQTADLSLELGVMPSKIHQITAKCWNIGATEIGPITCSFESEGFLILHRQLVLTWH